jgi:glycosyltransferase involved in cell wall biosynthesis
MDKPRLLIATDTFLPRRDGISIFLSRAIPHLAERFAVTVVAPGFGPVEPKGYEFVGIPVERRVFGEFRFTRRSPKLKNLVARADVVFSHTIGPISTICVEEARARGIPCIAYVHSHEWELIPRYLNLKRLRWIAERIVIARMRRVYTKMSLVIVPSQDEALLFQTHGIHVPTRIVHVGIDPYRFVANANKVEAKQAVGLDHTHTVIGYTGRISYEKDLETLLRAFLWVKRGNEKTTLVLVGSGIPELEEKLASKRGVVHVKSVADVTAYLQAMDIYAMPSLTETSSLSTLEAMSCKLPVVTTRVGLMKHYIRDGENGYTFTRGDWMALARRIKELSNDVILRNRLGEEARKTVLNGFVLEKSCADLIEALETVL